MSKFYQFDPEEAIRIIRKDWNIFNNKMIDTVPHTDDPYPGFRYVIGISGGKDSLVAAALAKREFGADKVIGVLMPNGEQADIKDSIRICDEVLGIKRIEINIAKAFLDLTYQFFHQVHLTSRDTDINLPPRLRMATLYMVAQSMQGIVVNTCNLSEDMVGYATLFGDNAGSYAPLKNLTVTEIRKIGDALGLPHELVYKTPADGLQDNSDEDRLGLTYASIDDYIRFGSEAVPAEIASKIDAKYKANKFKLDMVRIEGPEFPYPNYVIANNEPVPKPPPTAEEVLSDCSGIH